ncbi:hypothetical protein FJ365_03225 [Candidatus Dependentiae bacterium]|nr:hypothetical protein [Candidatus Dependentiae bacterium]
MKRNKKMMVALGLCVMMGMSGLNAMVKLFLRDKSSRASTQVSSAGSQASVVVPTAPPFDPDDGTPNLPTPHYTIVKGGGKQLNRTLSSGTLGRVQETYAKTGAPVKFTDSDGVEAVYVPAARTQVTTKPSAPPAEGPDSFQPEVQPGSRPAVPLKRQKSALPAAGLVDGSDGADQDENSSALSAGALKKKKHQDLAQFTATSIEKRNFKKITVSDSDDPNQPAYTKTEQYIKANFNQLRNAAELPKGSRVKKVEMNKSGAVPSQTATVYKAGSSAEARARRRAVEDMRANVEEHVATESDKMRMANAVFVNRIFRGAKDVVGDGQNTAAFRNVRSAYTAAYKDENEAKAAALADANKLANLYAKHGSTTTVFKRFKANMKEKVQTLSGAQLACYIGAGILLSPVKGPLLLFSAMVAIYKIPSVMRRRRLEKPLRKMLAAYDITDDDFVKMRTMARKVEEANDPKATLEALNEVVSTFTNNEEPRKEKQQKAQQFLRDESAAVADE